jgi:flagellar hook-length control protein FliK
VVATESAEAVNVTTMAALVALLPRLSAGALNAGSPVAATSQAPSRSDEGVTRVGSAGSVGDGSLLARQMSLAMTASARESAALLPEGATTTLEARAAQGLAAASPAEGAPSLTTLAAPVAATRGHEWSALKLESAPSQWGHQLLDYAQGAGSSAGQSEYQQAHLRRIHRSWASSSVTVRVEGSAVSGVECPQPALRDALLQSSERLRMSLSTQHSGGVVVNVGQGDRHANKPPPRDCPSWPVVGNGWQRSPPVNPDPRRVNALV